MLADACRRWRSRLYGGLLLRTNLNNNRSLCESVEPSTGLIEIELKLYEMQ